MTAEKSRDSRRHLILDTSTLPRTRIEFPHRRQRYRVCIIPDYIFLPPHSLRAGPFALWSPPNASMSTVIFSFVKLQLAFKWNYFRSFNPADDNVCNVLLIFINAVDGANRD